MLRDVYVSFDGVSEDSRVIITARLKPFMLWLWIGAAMIISGIAVTVFEIKR